MKLIPIKDLPSNGVKQFLWKMLADRDPVVNISHKKMPTWNEHCAFVDSHPYRDWLIVTLDAKWIGQIYLTNANEIGIHLLPNYIGRGHGAEAVRRLMTKYGPGRYLANVAIDNIASQDFFRSLGFKLIQYTFELDMT